MNRTLAVVAGAVATVVLAATTVVAMAAGHRDRDDGPWPRGGMHQQVAAAGTSTELSWLAGMVAHHQEAVTAAQELRRSERPQLRAFGASVVASQSAQVRQMQAWLAEWYPGRSTDLGYRPMMRDLSGLSGDELDRAFLEDMIPHHMAAVMMSQQLLVRGTARHESVATLAETIRDEQHAEIFQMQRWLAAWFDVDWTHGGMGMGMGVGPGMMW